MLSLRNRFGIPGVISVIALVFAMLGGAYAASDNGGSGDKASASAKKGPRGPKGPKGPAGPAGPQGPAGPAGAKGDKGDAGSNGANGSNGADGKSVTGTPIAAGGVCGPGVTGVKYSLDGTDTNVCNGKNGTNGQTGFTETLPGGKTETGVWTFGQLKAGSAPGFAGTVRVPISFAIPLNNDLGATSVHYINSAGEEVSEFGSKEEPSTVCTGSAADPTADPGHLCVYTAFLTFALSFNEGIKKAGEPGPGDVVGASTAGATLNFFGTEDGARGYGTWAVTAEEE